MSIAHVIHEAKAVFASAGLDCGYALLPPVDDSDIDIITEELFLPVPSELRAVYRIHGGQEYVPPGNSGLFGSHRLLTPAELISEHRMTTETSVSDPLMAEWGANGEPPYWDDELLPFALWNDSYLCIHSRLGEVWHFRPYDGMTTRWPSIESVLREVIAGAEATAEKPSWRQYLPADVSDVHEWFQVQGFLPASCWYQLKARLTVPQFQEFVRQLQLTSNEERDNSDAPRGDDLWHAQPGFDGDWWDPSPTVAKTFFSVGEVPSSLAKYENGYLYFKLWQPMTGGA